MALVVVTALLWVGVARLALAFLQSSLDWAYVAQQSRSDAPWYYRLAGVWGGMEGSLLLFTALVASAWTLAARRAAPVSRWAAAVSAAALGAVVVALASPFDRLAVPATRGFGMNPILEHPAMAIHPPLLYLGLAASAGAAVAAAGGTTPWHAARRWLLASIALLTAAMALGGAWSYMEQGWGGYWAWDPVENTSLLVWLAALVAIHAGPLGSPRLGMVACLAPWVVALFGAALVRSGSTPSVHGFAEQHDVGWALLAVAVVTAAASGFAVARRTSTRPTEPAAPMDHRRVMATLAAVAAATVIVGTAAPVARAALGGRSVLVRGEFFSRTVGPLAAIAVPFLAVRLRRPWRISSAAHAGALLLLVGIAASTFDATGTVPIPEGESVRVAGVEVRNDGIEVGPGSRLATEAVTAVLDIDGHQMRPRLVVHPDRGGRLAEVAVRTGPWTDVHALLDGASDNGTIVVTIQRRHGMWLVWLGAAIVSGAVLVGASRVKPSRRTTRRSSPDAPPLAAVPTDEGER